MRFFNAVPTVLLTLSLGLPSLSRVSAQGPLTPPGAPGPTMKTLDQVEARTPVDLTNTPGDASASFVISTPGSYYLTADVAAATQDGIRISADGVTLDLNGFELRRASGTGGSAVLVLANHCTIRNGRVNGFDFGIKAITQQKGRFEDLILHDVGIDGIQGGTQVVIERCTLESIGGTAIQAGIASIVRYCTIKTTGSNGIDASETCLIENNVINNTNGDSIRVTVRSVVRGNLIDFPLVSGAGIKATGFLGNNCIENNTVLRRNQGIVLLGTNNRVAGNQVRFNNDNYDFVDDNQINLLISQLPESLDWPCTAVLDGNLLTGSDGVSITSSDVTLDLGGHSLRCTGFSGTDDGVTIDGGVSNELARVTVRNGAIAGFNIGIRAEGVQHSQFEDLQISENRSSGFYLSGNGKTSSGNQVRRCQFDDNGGYGLQLDAMGATGICRGNSIDSCTLNGNASGGMLLLGLSLGRVHGNQITKCTLSSNQSNGIFLAGSDSGTVTGNRIDGNHIEGTTGETSYGIRTGGSSSNIIIRNSCIGQVNNFSISGSDSYGPLISTTGELDLFDQDMSPWANFDL